MIARTFADPWLFASLVVSAFALGVLATFGVLELEWLIRSRRARRPRARMLDLTATPRRRRWFGRARLLDFDPTSLLADQLRENRERA